MVSAYGPGCQFGGGDIYPVYLSIGPLTISRLDDSLSIICTSEIGHYPPISIYEEDKFGAPTLPLMSGAVKFALVILKQYMVLDDLAGV